MTPEEILKEHPKGMEYARTSRRIRATFPSSLMLRNEAVASVPPIINGALTTITEETTEVLIDVTGLGSVMPLKPALNIVAAASSWKGWRN